MVSRILFAICISVMLVSCNDKDEGFVQYQLRDVKEQYHVDSLAIRDFMEEYAIEEQKVDDKTVYKITAKKDGGLSIADHAGLSSITYEVDELEYKIYYLKFSEGKNIQPIRFDSLFVSYKGMNLKNETFLDNEEPRWEAPSKTRKSGELFSLTAPQLVSTLFKSGDFTPKGDGTFEFKNYGHGIVIVPSGLGFFDLTQSNLEAYSPFVLEFKLHHVRQRDHDGDGVKTFEERTLDDKNPFDGFYELDTDGDGIANFMDNDDDGDGVLTKKENEKVNVIIDGVEVLKFKDTDGKDGPDYLDNDDDGDGTLTKDEDTNGNGDWTDDDNDKDDIPNYLDKDDK